MVTRHKHRKKRRKNGIKGCCVHCACVMHAGGLKNKRLPTAQERRAPRKDGWLA